MPAKFPEARPDKLELVRQITAAYAEAEDRAQAQAAGYQLHLAKPVEPAKRAWKIVHFYVGGD
jgi:CheY-like chemotaxis protein